MKDEFYEIKELSNANYIITQDLTYPERFDLTEIICELEKAASNMKTHAMSDHVLFLKGQKSGVEQVIAYLKRIRD